MSICIKLEQLTLDFPIYGLSSRSIKNSVIRSATGGRITHSEHEQIVVRALDQINLHFKEGDKVGITGHNGSGKSTLLKVIAGVYEPNIGSCKVTGRISSMLNLLLGMHPDSTGLENIKLRSKLMGVTTSEIDAIIDEVIEFSDLNEYIHMPMRTYSSGMAMRLGFAVSTAIQADILLMDEWMSVGDSEFKTRADIKLAQVLDNTKIFILASHNEETIRKNCNKLIRLHKGKIESIESIE